MVNRWHKDTGGIVKCICATSMCKPEGNSYGVQNGGDKGLNMGTRMGVAVHFLEVRATHITQVRNFSGKALKLQRRVSKWEQKNPFTTVKPALQNLACV